MGRAGRESLGGSFFDCFSSSPGASGISGSPHSIIISTGPWGLFEMSSSLLPYHHKQSHAQQE